jgi:hypothetical protein
MLMLVRWWINPHPPAKSDVWFKLTNATSCQCSIILEDISGFVNLDGSMGVKDREAGWDIATYSLCTILLKKYLRLCDRHQ